MQITQPISTLPVRTQTLQRSNDAKLEIGLKQEAPRFEGMKNINKKAKRIYNRLNNKGKAMVMGGTSVGMFTALWFLPFLSPIGLIGLVTIGVPAVAAYMLWKKDDKG